MERSIIKEETEGSKKEKKRFIHLFSARHCAMCYVDILTLNLHVILWGRFYSLHSMVKDTDRFCVLQGNLPKVSLLETVKLILVLTQYDYRGLRQNLNFHFL